MATNRFERIPLGVTAFKWDDNYGTQCQIQTLFPSAKVHVHTDGTMSIMRPEACPDWRWVQIPVGYWLVLHASGWVEAVAHKAFRAEYRPTGTAV